MIFFSRSFLRREGTNTNFNDPTNYEIKCSGIMDKNKKEEKLELVMNFESEDVVLCLEDRDFLSQMIHSPEYRIITRKAEGKLCNHLAFLPSRE